MPTNTVVYSEGFQGFPSFYSFEPDYMIGMNQYFYTFKGGNLYRHNVNATRNEFYGVSSPSKVKTVFNEQVLDSKLFKTLNIEGTHAWDVDLESDYTDLNGQVLDSYFEKKEGSFFSFIRLNNTVINEQTWELRTLSGIATSLTVTQPSPTVVNFAMSIDLGSQMSIGDFLFYAVSPTYTPILIGAITNIEVDKTNNINRITVATTAVTIPSNTEYFLYMKDPAAEDFGMLGHYMVANMSNDTYNEYVELFVLRSEVMKSFP